MFCCIIVVVIVTIIIVVLLRDAAGSCCKSGLRQLSGGRGLEVGTLRVSTFCTAVLTLVRRRGLACRPLPFHPPT
jgi:preprotein translocase subunit SecG